MRIRDMLYIIFFIPTALVQTTSLYIGLDRLLLHNSHNIAVVFLSAVIMVSLPLISPVLPIALMPFVSKYFLKGRSYWIYSQKSMPKDEALQRKKNIAAIIYCCLILNVVIQAIVIPIGARKIVMYYSLRSSGLLNEILTSNVVHTLLPFSGLLLATLSFVELICIKEN